MCTLDLQRWREGHNLMPNRSLEVGSPERPHTQSPCPACQVQPDMHASLRRSPATLEEERAPAGSEVANAAVSGGCEAAGLLPPEQSKKAPTCESDVLLAPLCCAPVSTPNAEAAWGGPPPPSTEAPAGLRVWTPSMAQVDRRPDVLRAASPASSASGSAETPAGVRVGTPAWSAWRRRRDLLRAPSQESGASGAETPAGPAEGAPAWRVAHDLGRAARAPGDMQHHDVAGEVQLARAGTLKRAHSEAEPLPAAAAQVAGMSQSDTEIATQRFHGDSGVLVSPTCPCSCSWHPVYAVCAQAALLRGQHRACNNSVHILSLFSSTVSIFKIRQFFFCTFQKELRQRHRAA